MLIIQLSVDIYLDKFTSLYLVENFKKSYFFVFGFFFLIGVSLTFIRLDSVKTF